MVTFLILYINVKTLDTISGSPSVATWSGAVGRFSYSVSVITYYIIVEPYSDVVQCKLRDLHTS